MQKDFNFNNVYYYTLLALVLCFIFFDDISKYIDTHIIVTLLILFLLSWWSVDDSWRYITRKDKFKKLDSSSTLDVKNNDEKKSVYAYTNPQLAKKSIQKSSSPTSISNNKSLTSIPTEKILPPENFFNVPRKIDWDELNKTRKYNGDLGELFVYDLEVNYLTKIGRSDLAEKVEHVAKEGDGHGYDIKSFYENGSKKYIEVKATNASSGSTFNISRNEFNFLQAHLSNAVIYHVHNVNNERETTVVIYPAGEVLNSPNIFPSGYVVKM